uniref:PEP-CTERM/exosortase system-associated acyltransferase n=1 Tax=uncultured bacterium CSLC3 TaxID=1091572 RepID=G4WVU9_9BACT|nr:PEP-CTERM/exosortase system-associated acyltransferase [uncultured bacterium CSLC3]
MKSPHRLCVAKRSHRVSDLFPEILKLRSTFKQYFEIVPALSDALKDEVFRIRHQVYCEDLAFEPRRLDKRESDEFDVQSLHLLIRSVRTHQFIGCTRIIRVRPDDPQQLLPFERSCAETIDRSIVDPARLTRSSIAEVSRLAVISPYRRRKGESKTALSMSDSDFVMIVHPRFPFIPVALYLGTVELARLHGIETLFVLTEPRLASHFKRLGVEIQTIGATVEHRGRRIPSMMSTSAILKNLRMIFRPLYRTIAKEVAAGLTDTSARVTLERSDSVLQTGVTK